MFLCLSHRVNENSPGWPGNPTLRLEPHPVRLKQYAINHCVVTIFNHFGTHIDGPNHFNPLGARVTELPFDFFIFDRPVVLDLRKDDDDLITAVDLESQYDLIKEADLLLIRTGFGRLRCLQPERYAEHFPGLSPDAGVFIVERLPTVRAVGIDTISIGSYHHLDEALEVHSILARESNRGRHIVNIEDLNLDYDLRGLARVMAVPLFIEGIDSAPAVVVAEVADRR